MYEGDSSTTSSPGAQTKSCLCFPQGFTENHSHPSSTELRSKYIYTTRHAWDSLGSTFSGLSVIFQGGVSQNVAPERTSSKFPRNLQILRPHLRIRNSAEEAQESSVLTSLQGVLMHECENHCSSREGGHLRDRACLCPWLST